MVTGAFPAAKLTVLIVRQINKPVTGFIKELAKKSPLFRRYICMPPAQFYNWCEIQAKMWILELGRPTKIPELNEASAIDLGGNLLGEGFMFLMALSGIIYEYKRSVKKEAAKEEAKRQEIAQIRDKVTELFIQSETQAAQLRELLRKMGDSDSRLRQPKNPNEPPPVPPKNLRLPGSPVDLEHLGLSAQLSEKSPSFIPSSEHPPTHVPAPKGANFPYLNTNLPQHAVSHSNATLYKGNNFSVHKSIVLRAVDDVENQFWSSPLVERQNSIIVLAVYHVNKLFRFQQ